MTEKDTGATEENASQALEIFNRRWLSLVNNTPYTPYSTNTPPVPTPTKSTCETQAKEFFSIMDQYVFRKPSFYGTGGIQELITYYNIVSDAKAPDCAKHYQELALKYMDLIRNGNTNSAGELKKEIDAERLKLSN